MTESAADFKARLIRRTGLTESALTAAWPDWWSEAAEHSPSAQAELRFSVARKLGLDAHSLIADGEPRFLWDAGSRFKGFSGDPDMEKPALTSFGLALANLLLQATPAIPFGQQIEASALRKLVLEGRNYVGLPELLATSWAMGIPVIHLRVYPLSAKRMSAMCVRLQNRYVILMARDAQYPAPSAFHLAHELGHIFRRHLTNGQSIVDLETTEEISGSVDPEELEADEFAMELLTGRPRLDLQVQGDGRGARSLASEAHRIGAEERIEPGTIAMAYGHATKKWDTAIASLRHIYSQPYDAWRAINSIANSNLQWDNLPDDSAHYLHLVMGATDG